MPDTLSRTPLHHAHVAHGGRLVPFAGWDLPVQFSGILAEVRAVRTQCGAFDVSHMGRLYLSGRDALPLLEWTCSNAVASLNEDRARYTLFCNERGGIIDDGIFYNLGQGRYLLICNASNRAAVVAWLKRWNAERFHSVSLDDRTERTAMIALQGPSAAALADRVSDGAPSSTRAFGWTETVSCGVPSFLGRTGYTGEDGFELVVRAEDAERAWERLISEGATPCGLGARDVLRLEAALPLHGNDIDQTTTPLEAGLDRFVKMDQGGFVGHDALVRQQRDGLPRKLAGFTILGREIARHGYPVLRDGRQVGAVTSGGPAPTLGKNVGMAYIPPALAALGTRLQVDIRGRLADVEVSPMPFYSRRRG